MSSWVIVFGVSAELLSLRRVLHTLEREADGTLGRKAIFQLIRAHCTSLVDLTMVQTLESLPISKQVGGRRTNSPAKRLRSGEIVDDVVENSFESFVERVAESGTYDRLVHHFGKMAEVIEPVLSDHDDGIEFDERFFSAVNEVEPLNGLILQVCATFNLPTVVINTTDAESGCTALVVHPSTRRRQFASDHHRCGTSAVRLDGRFMAVSDREKLALGFVVGLLGMVPCAVGCAGDRGASEVKRDCDQGTGNRGDEEDGDGEEGGNEIDTGSKEVVREPAWINIFHDNYC